MKVTYAGHGCLLIETQGTKLLFDPFISPNPLLKDLDAPHIQADTIEADYILLTHGHGDHVHTGPHEPELEVHHEHGRCGRSLLHEHGRRRSDRKRSWVGVSAALRS